MTNIEAPALQGRRELARDDEARVLSAPSLNLNRQWASWLLLAGSVTGSVAFLLATCTGGFNSMIGYEMRYACWTDEGPRSECESKRSYHAETVSEMVSNGDTPAGKLFYAFTVIASLCLLISRYPWEFPNVYIRSTRSWFPISAIRSIVPPLGMLIVAQVPVVPRQERTTPAIKLSCHVHTFGAVLFVLGYNVLEMLTLCELRRKLKRRERLLRIVCVVASTVFMICFALCGNLYGTSSGDTDQYENSWDKYQKSFNISNATTPHQKAVNEITKGIVQKTYGKQVLVNSANGWPLKLKKAEFWSEELAGLFIIFSHFVIWSHGHHGYHSDDPLLT